MNDKAVRVFEYDARAVSISEKEYRRYMGIGSAKTEESVESLISDSLRELEGALKIRGCYRLCDVALSGEDGVDLEFTNIQSRALRKNLSGCGKAVVFAVTVGIEVDRLIARYNATTPSRAVVMDAVASAAVEAAAEKLCLDLENKYGKMKPRFSPGYGDLPLSYQPSFCEYVDCGRKAGIRLTETFMLIPMKTTTAITGILGEE